MKKIIALSLIFAVLGCGLLVGSSLLCLTSLNAKAIMVEMPTAAQECSENLMTSLQDGDFTAASDYLYGQVDLGVSQEPKDPTTKFIWEAFEESITYEFIGDCYATTTGVARDVWITTLDPASFNQNLTQRVEEKAEAEGIAIYDDEGKVQQDALDMVLMDVLADILENDATTRTQKVRLNLVFQNGQWWVVPDAALLQAISGGVAG